MTHLSEQKIKSLRWDGQDKTLGDGHGLYLLLRKSSKTWIVRRRHNGKNQITTLGKWPSLPLKKARAQATSMATQTATSAVTMVTLVDKYMREVIEPTHKRVDLVQGYMKRAVLPELGSRKVEDVTRAELVSLVQAYAKRGPRSADQLRSNLKKLFGYAVELGYRETNPMLEVTSRVTGYIPTPRSRVLSDDEIRQLWAWDSPNTKLLRFLLLTGLRISEAQKGHADGDRWIVPEDLSKNGLAHWVFLTQTARAQTPLPRTTPTNAQSWIRRKLDKFGVSPRYTPHDLRRTAATRMADCGVEPFIVERVLNHKLEGVMAVYNRAEYMAERIEAAKMLESHVLEVVR